MKMPYYIDYTSIFINIPVIIAMFFLSVLTSYFHLNELSAVLMLLAFIALTSFIWGHLSLRHTIVTLKIDRHVVSPGEEVIFHHAIENSKWMPLVGVMLRVPVPYDECIMPVEKENYRQLDDIEVSKARIYKAKINYVAEQKFAFLKGNSTICWEVRWRAQKRGLYRIKAIELYGGDGFGLIQSYAEITAGKDEYVAVCPNLTEINKSIFLRNTSISNRGEKAIYDDVTLIKSNRDYQQYDNIKHVNWKILATQQKLTVNIYEKMKTKNIHLILDGESYNGEKPKAKALEKTLQIIYSILVEMDSIGMGCGLSLPRSKLFQAVYLSDTANENMEQAFYYLAGYDLLQLKNEDDGEEKKSVLLGRSSLATTILEARKIKQKQEGTYMLSVSEFDPADACPYNDDIDEYFYFTYDSSRMHLRETGLLEALHEKNVTIVSYRNYVTAYHMGSRVNRSKSAETDLYNKISLSSLGGSFGTGSK